MNVELPSSAAGIAPRRGLLPFLGLICSIGVSSIYYNQPLLVEMGKTYHATAADVGFVAVATQVGYALGLLFFVPLGDVLERRMLMIRMFGAVALALLLAALAPKLSLLIAASVLVGCLASVTHIALPIAPDLVDDTRRGHAIGIVMTGLLLGILLARTFAGWVSSLGGWKTVFLIAAVMNAAFVPLLWRVMPKLPPTHPVKYGEALRSLWTLFREQPVLRESCVLGALVFAAFSCFWTTLVFLLGSSHYHMGAGVAGSFGILGATGALTAPVAGRLSDKYGSRFVLTIALSTLAVSFVVLWVLGYHMLGLVLGVVLMDGGAQMNQLANQTRIFGLVPSARSRINTVYMTVYFSGASVGSALSTIAWERWQWNGVCGLGLTFIGLAALRHATGDRGFGQQARLQPEDVLLEA
jgi:predicted MFS family arabinose efflux permease